MPSMNINYKDKRQMSPVSDLASPESRSSNFIFLCLFLTVIMGKFSCLSCSCFSSSSTPQQVTTVVVHPTQPANSGHSTQPSQQPPNSGPSTPLLSSQPSQQPPNSTPSSSSQQAADADLESFLQKFNDISRLQDLIQFIEELLKKASGEKKGEGSSSAVAANYYIQDGQTILELVDKHIGKLPQKIARKRCSKSLRFTIKENAHAARSRVVHCRICQNIDKNKFMWDLEPFTPLAHGVQQKLHMSFCQIVYVRDLHVLYLCLQ